MLFTVICNFVRSLADLMPKTVCYVFHNHIHLIRLPMHYSLLAKFTQLSFNQEPIFQWRNLQICLQEMHVLSVAQIETQQALLKTVNLALCFWFIQLHYPTPVYAVRNQNISIVWYRTATYRLYYCSRMFLFLFLQWSWSYCYPLIER